MTRKSKEIAERFLSKVNKDGPIPIQCSELGPCHIWRAGVNADGYGRFRIGDRTENAHRVSFWLEHGRWPEPCALHRCDTPSCVNATHLFEGTNNDNVADRANKKRSARLPGSQNGMSKLSEQTVRDIRANYILCKVTHKELAAHFGVSKSLIGLVVRKEGWTHI